MRGVSRVVVRHVATAALMCIILSGSALAAEVRPRDPSFGDRIRAAIHRLVHVFNDQLIIPPA